MKKSVLLGVAFAFLLLAMKGMAAAGDIMPVPDARATIQYPALAFPGTSSDPGQSRPVGLGTLAEGGDRLSVRVGLPEFSGLVDIYIAYSVSTDPDALFNLGPDSSFQRLSFSEVVQSFIAGGLPAGVEPWRHRDIGPMDWTLFEDVPLSKLGSGIYKIYLLVTPSGSTGSHYLWITGFEVPEVEEPVSHVLSVSKQGTETGRIVSDPPGIDCGSDCSEEYPEETFVTLTAITPGGLHFDGWGGACNGTGTCLVMMEETRSVTASFSSEAFTVSASVSGSGGEISCSPTAVAQGGAFTCTITVYSGYLLKTLTDNGLSVKGYVANGQYTDYYVSENHVVVATFDRQPSSVAAYANGGGNISCGPASVAYGGSFICTITPYQGEELVMLKDNNTDVTGSVYNNEYTRINVKENHSVEATFTGQSSSLSYKEVTLSMLSPGVYRADVLLEKIGMKPAQKFYKVVVPPECSTSIQLSVSGVISADGYSNVNALYSVVPNTNTSSALAIYNEMLQYWVDNSIQGNLGRVSPIDGNTYWYKFTNDPETEILDLNAPLSSVYYMQVVNESQAGKFHLRVGCY